MLITMSQRWQLNAKYSDKFNMINDEIFLVCSDKVFLVRSDKIYHYIFWYRRILKCFGLASQHKGQKHRNCTHRSSISLCSVLHRTWLNFTVALGNMNHPVFFCEVHISQYFEITRTVSLAEPRASQVTTINNEEWMLEDWKKWQAVFSQLKWMISNQFLVAVCGPQLI